MKKLWMPAILFLFCNQLFAQDIDRVLAAVEQNNTLLLSLKQAVEAEKAGNKTDLYPENPEFEYHYLWGSPETPGNRTDFSIIQYFDFPTAYKFRSNISDISNHQAELNYLQQKNEVMLETSFLLYDLIYLNALHDELTIRMEHARELAKAYTVRLNAGDVNILEYNKAQITLLNLSKELNAIAITRDAALMDLQGLNGGNYMSFTQSHFNETDIPDDFETWYETAKIKNPVLEWLEREQEKNENQVKLARALSLPKFHSGYMSEKVANEKFQGLAAGLSIPLWENKNKVAHALAVAEATQSQINHAALRFYNQLKTLHLKAVGLQDNLSDYQEQLAALEHSGLLRKALDAGEITLIEYILELSVFYESVDKMLELQTELHKVVAELNRYN